MMKKTCLLALTALLAATAASASAKDNNQGDKPAVSDQKANSDSNKKKDKKEKLICHTDRATGSLTRVRRICHTAAEWNEIAQQTNKTVNDLGRNENLGSETGSSNGANNTAGFGF